MLLNRKVIIITEDLKEWINTIEGDIKFLRQEINKIALQNQEKMKTLSNGINRYKDELSGQYKEMEAKTKVKVDVKDVLLQQIEKSSQFQTATKQLENGGDINLTLGVKMKQKELPLELQRDGKGTITREFQSTSHNDDSTREKVEESIKTKHIVKDKNGYSFEE